MHSSLFTQINSVAMVSVVVGNDNGYVSDGNKFIMMS